MRSIAMISGTVNSRSIDSLIFSVFFFVVGEREALSTVERRGV